jgi:hypothetical protein
LLICEETAIGSSQVITMIRFLSVILYLDHADTVVQYLHKALASAPKGALLVIADAPYGKTFDEEGFEELTGKDWKLVAENHFKRESCKCIDDVIEKGSNELTCNDWNTVATHFTRGRNEYINNIIEKRPKVLASSDWNSVVAHLKAKRVRCIDDVMKDLWPKSFKVTDLGKSMWNQAYLYSYWTRFCLGP